MEIRRTKPASFQLEEIWLSSFRAPGLSLQRKKKIFLEAAVQVDACDCRSFHALYALFG
jgi:hypothetical protein